MAIIQVINGPNLNLLGQREPQYYGIDTLASIQTNLEHIAISHGHKLSFIQSNAEHVLIDTIHAAIYNHINFIIINPAAFTHTSIALRDALLAVSIPFIEIHLSNVHSREPFRAHSYFSDIAMGVISGFGAYSYELALQVAIRHLNLNISTST
jgi:3-dehydroquinate dehydratase-2